MPRKIDLNKVRAVEHLNSTTLRFGIGEEKEVLGQIRDYRDDVVVGGLDPLKVEPKVNMTRWKWGRHPTNIEIALKTDADKVTNLRQIGEVAKLEAPDFDFNVYGREPQVVEGRATGERGELEIELVLKSKPATNVFEWTVNTPDLEWFYQPALTQAEIDEGASRPENVTGSYAVYSKTSSEASVDPIVTPANVHRVGMKSKAFHVFRPELTDGDGNKSWGELHYENGILSVRIPDAIYNNPNTNWVGFRIK